MRSLKLSISIIKDVATNVAGMLILNAVAFYNKFPLVYTDTGTYIGTGFSGNVPYDRTIFYGLFIKHTTHGISPWPTTLAQGFIVSWLLFKLFKLLYNERGNHFAYLIVLIFVTATTGVSFNVSILIPDIFASICLLASFLLLFTVDLSRTERITLIVILSYGISVHLSHIPILLISLVLFYSTILILRKYANIGSIPLKSDRVKMIVLTLLITVFTIPFANYLLDRKFELSSGGHVFLLNHLREIGVLKDYLKNNCERQDYQLCNYQNNLEGDFMWDQNSPLYITGGWIKNKEEYGRIIRGILLSPKYYSTIILAGAQFSFTQLITFHSTVDVPQRKNSPPHGLIRWRFNSSENAYLNSKQNTNGYVLASFNFLEYLIVCISLILIISLILSRNVNPYFFFAVVWSLLFTVVSAIICANLSTVNARYINRVIWIIVFLATTGLLQLISQKYFQKTQ